MEYHITGLRATITNGCGGMNGYEAEATLELEGFKEIYAHACYIEGGITYDVSETSWYDYLTGESKEKPADEPTFIEECEDEEEANASEYRKAYNILRDMIKALA